MNFIYWTPGTDECTYLEPLSVPVPVSVPNEEFETGFRANQIPFPEPPPDDEKFRAMHSKLFADGPKLKFVASDKFVGPLFGYVFKMGEKGLGYYIDSYIMRYVFYK